MAGENRSKFYPLRPLRRWEMSRLSVLTDFKTVASAGIGVFVSSFSAVLCRHPIGLRISAESLRPTLSAIVNDRNRQSATQRPESRQLLIVEVFESFLSAHAIDPDDPKWWGSTKSDDRT